MLIPPLSKLLVVPALATFVLATNAGAAIVFFDPEPDIPIPTTYAGVSVDLETGGVSNLLEGLPGGDANFFFGGAELSNDGDQAALTPSWQPVRSGTGNTDPVLNLALGTTVDGTGAAGGVYSTGFGGSGDPNSNFAEFTAGERGYIGFSLDLDGGGTVFGYMWVTLEDNDTPGFIHSWAYEDTGAPILVGAVPEPGSAALVVLGLSAVALRRRR